MKKTLKRWGHNLVLVFTKEEEELYGLVEKDIIELEDMLFQKKEEK
jgi:hypothetical protein